MKSYGRPSGGVLDTLLDLRVEGRAAGGARARGGDGGAACGRGRGGRLAAEVAGAERAVAAARRDGGQGPDDHERAADAQARRRYWARLEAVAAAAVDALARHRTNALARAIAADAAARDAHVRARQRREVVEKAIARRQAAARREADRREEAAMDDRYRPRARTNTPTTGR